MHALDKMVPYGDERRETATLSPVAASSRSPYAEAYAIQQQPTYAGQHNTTVLYPQLTSAQKDQQQQHLHVGQPQQPPYAGHMNTAPTDSMYPQLTGAQVAQHQQHQHVVQSQPQVQQYPGQPNPVIVYMQQPHQCQQQQQQPQYDPKEFNSGFCSCCADCGVCCQVMW
jgi:hypothetical protein